MAKRKQMRSNPRRLKKLVEVALAPAERQAFLKGLDEGRAAARREFTRTFEINQGEVRLMDPPFKKFAEGYISPGVPFALGDHRNLHLYGGYEAPLAIRFEWITKVHAIDTPRGPLRVVWWSPQYRGVELC